MADLEQHAIKRDKRFLVRLIVGLGIALLAGILVWSWLASEAVGGCAARSFGNITETPEQGGAPPNQGH
jgi:hypothetical protein